MRKSLKFMAKAVTVCLLACAVLVFTAGTEAHASSTEVPSLDEISSVPTSEPTPTEGKAENNSKEFIEGMQDAADLSAKDPKATEIGVSIQKVASIIVQVLCYAITAGLVIRVLLDLAFIGLPFVRSALANGYMGNPNVAGQQQDPSMMGGAGMMGGGMMGGPGMMGGGMGMGGYGRRGMMGGGMMGGPGMMGGMQNQQMGNQMAMNNQPRQGKIQFVSNAALNAVATESVIGPDGRGNSAFKTYSKDMIIVLVVTPILLTLAITGVLADFGFMLGGVIESAIRGISL